MIFDGSWQLVKVPNKWGKTNVIPVFVREKKEDPGNYRPQFLRR